MEPVTTGAVLTFLAALAIKGFEKAFETGGEKISEGAISWIRSLFYKGDKPKKILEDLQADPNDPEKLNIAKAIIDNSIEDEPKREDFIKEILEKTFVVKNTIMSSKNVNTGDVNTSGGDFRIGDDYGK